MDYNQIKLVLPIIVEHETFIHLEEELDKVGKNIEAAMDKIKNLYGVQGYTIAGLDIQDYKKKSRNHLNEALKMFQEGKEQYKEELFNVVNMMFEHKNCIRIEDDEFLDVLVMRRKIYKRAPFHKEQKESYADSLIIETLINIKNILKLEMTI
ncbi:MAG: PIN domain-containing protein [Bacteroidales bacterium]|nr:PIN domain-containing protein [Clostridium sp.]MCM1204903.1 PIN domain-containing protein [Bacteroidales bacterium]